MEAIKKVFDPGPREANTKASPRKGGGEGKGGSYASFLILASPRTSKIQRERKKRNSPCREERWPATRSGPEMQGWD